MKCSKCGKENNSSSKFCKHCGEPLNGQVKANNKITKDKKIIVLLIVIILILTVGVLYGMGFFKGEVPLETHDFGAFKMDVPVGSNFVVSEEGKALNGEYLVMYVNKGDYSNNVNGIFIGKKIDKNAVTETSEFIEKQGNMEIYKNVTNGYTIYSVYLTEDNCQLFMYGFDLDTLKKVAGTFKEVDINKLSSNSVPLTTSAQSSTSSTPSSTPSSMSILGGSFSTGSAESDKTYARINVGKQHAGESVIVQIWYSRDGNTLNHGNMVPASVHSDGYLEIASADAYHYYPDHATINIYDSNSRLLTTQSVNLSPSSGTQTF